MNFYVQAEKWDADSNWRTSSSDGLKPPTRSYWICWGACRGIMPRTNTTSCAFDGFVVRIFQTPMTVDSLKCWQPPTHPFFFNEGYEGPKLTLITFLGERSASWSAKRRPCLYLAAGIIICCFFTNIFLPAAKTFGWENVFWSLGEISDPQKTPKWCFLRVPHFHNTPTELALKMRWTWAKKWVLERSDFFLWGLTLAVRKCIGPNLRSGFIYI